jgi:hypothetical protein
MYGGAAFVEFSHALLSAIFILSSIPVIHPFPKAMMQIYTTDKTSPRAFGWLWFMRLVGIIFTLIVLGIAAGDIADFHNASCSAPSKLSFNLAVVRWPQDFVIPPPELKLTPMI